MVHGQDNALLGVLRVGIGVRPRIGAVLPVCASISAEAVSSGTFSIFGCVPHAMSAAEHSTSAKTACGVSWRCFARRSSSGDLPAFFAASRAAERAAAFSQAAAFFSTLASAVCTSLAAVCASSSVSSAIEAQKKCRRKGRRDTPRSAGSAVSPANAALYGALRAAGRVFTALSEMARAAAISLMLISR